MAMPFFDERAAHTTCYLSFYLLCHQLLCTVKLPKCRLFDFACGIYGYLCKNNTLGALVAGKLLAKLFNLLLRAGHSLFYGDDCSGNLSQTLVRQADNSHVLYLLIGT